MNYTACYSGATPVAAVESVLDDILSKRVRNGIPMKGFKRAAGWLKRKGVTFLVTLKVPYGKEEKTDVVPIRVTDDNVICSRYGRVEAMKSWRGRQIYNICVRYYRDISEVTEKMMNLLKSIASRIIHRIQRKIRTNNRKLNCVRVDAGQRNVH